MFGLPVTPPFLDGLYLGINAVPDAWLVVDAPAGCYFKLERIALNHDLNSTLFHPLARHRIAQTGIDYPDLVMGTEQKVRDIVRRVVQVASPPMVFLTETSVTQVTSNDLSGVAEDLARELERPVVFIRPDLFNGDYLDGYEAFLNVLAKQVRAMSGQLEPDVLAVVGYLFDRNEEDHHANTSEMKRMALAMGYREVVIWLDGSDIASLMRVGSAATLVALPCGQKAARLIAKQTGARVVELGLPVGISGTANWVRSLGRALGRDAAAEAFCRVELERLVPEADRIRESWLQDRRVAIAAEPELALGLLDFLSEMGMEVPLVVARSRREGRVGRLLEAASRLGVHVEVLYDPTASGLRARLRSLGALDVVVGSSQERAAAWPTGAGFVEIGYPSFITHAFHPRPFVGFSGVRNLLTEIGNAIRAKEFSSAFKEARSPNLVAPPGSE